MDGNNNNNAKPPKLPSKQTFILCFTLFSDALNLTIIFPFIVFLTAESMDKPITDHAENSYAAFLAGNVSITVTEALESNY